MKYSVNALHKTATVFLNKFFDKVAVIKKTKCYRERNIEKFNRSQEDCILGTIRYFPTKLDENIFYFIVLRNPLDMLVSQYYSFGWTHPIPKSNTEIFLKNRKLIQDMSIDTYCMLTANDLYEKFKPLLDNVLSAQQGNNHMILSYEELVLNFERWCERVCSGLDFPINYQKYLYNVFKKEFLISDEVLPQSIFDGSKKHKRKMIPGDHKEKLTPKTINNLNEKFLPFFKYYGHML